MFDTLLQLPLFQGLAHEDFTAILAKVKLHFAKHKAGERLAGCGEECRQLMFVIKGNVWSTISSKDLHYSVSEELQAPYVIEPHSLFGMHTVYAATYVAQTEVHTVAIDKSFVLDELFKYEIFRLNYINIACNRAQQLYNRLWQPVPADVEQRVVRFLTDRVERRAGTKSFKIKMDELAQNVNDTRTRVSKVLNKLQDMGMVELHRGEIVVPDMDKLAGA